MIVQRVFPNREQFCSFETNCKHREKPQHSTSPIIHKETSNHRTAVVQLVMQWKRFRTFKQTKAWSQVHVLSQTEINPSAYFCKAETPWSLAGNLHSISDLRCAFSSWVALGSVFHCFAGFLHPLVFLLFSSHPLLTHTPSIPFFCSQITSPFTSFASYLRSSDMVHVSKSEILPCNINLPSNGIVSDNATCVVFVFLHARCLPFAFNSLSWESIDI